jgi:hypothetical protein
MRAGRLRQPVFAMSRNLYIATILATCRITHSNLILRCEAR